MKKKILVLTIWLILILTLFGQVSYAAIEITPSASQGADVLRYTSVTNSFLLCRNMTNEGESLYGATVVPHLATNADWGAVSYLSNSIYGTNTVGVNTGVEITIDETKYYSTTGNITGVMNWGANPYKGYYTQTAGLAKVYVDDNSASTATSYVTELESNKDTRFVEVIDTANASFTNVNTLGMALSETSGLFSAISYKGTDVNYPISIRKGLFGFYVGCYYGSGHLTSGAANANVTFRPVIWNQ